MMELLRKHGREAKALVLAIMIFLSIFVLYPIMTKPETHAATLEVIDASKNKALGLTATVTIASTALTVIPDDVGTPLANEMADLSTPLMVIVCLLYFEKYLLTAMQGFSFGILIPVALLIYICCLYIRKKNWIIIANKTFIIALLCICMVPIGAGVTRMVEEAFAESLSVLDEDVKAIEAAFNQIIGGENNGDILAFIGNVATGVTTVFDFAKDALGLLVDSVAVLLITSCVIPAINILLFIWVIKSVIAGRMENLEDTAVDLWKRIPRKKKKEQEDKKNAHPSLPA